MEKKTYEQPQIEVFEAKKADIICTSPGATGNNTEGLYEENFGW